jgi:hypothetical protein
VASLTDSFNELYSEIDTDAQVSESARRLGDRVRRIQQYAEEIGYTKEEFEAIAGAQYSADGMRNLTQTLRNVTRAIRAGKKAVRLVGGLQKRAQLSEVDAARTSAESLAVQYMIYGEAQQKNLADVEKQLKEIADRVRAHQWMEGDMKRNGAFYLKGGKILGFRPNGDVIAKAFAISRMMIPVLVIVMVLMLGARIGLNTVTLATADSNVKVQKDFLLCCVILVAYPLAYHLIDIIGHALTQATGSVDVAPPGIDTTNTPKTLWEFARSNLRGLTVLICQGVKWLIFTILSLGVNFILAAMIAIFPLVAVVAVMTGHSGAVVVYLIGFFALSLWPVFWNVSGQLAAAIWEQKSAGVGDTLRDTIYATIFALMQIGAPVFGVIALKFGGQNPAAAIGGLAKTAMTKGTSSVIEHGAGVVTGASRREGGGSTIGKVLGYGINQTAGRVLKGTGAAIIGGMQGKGLKEDMVAAGAGFARGVFYNDVSGGKTSETGGDRKARALGGFQPIVKPQRKGGEGKNV